MSDIYLSLRRLCSHGRIPKKTSFVLFTLFVRHHRSGGRTPMIFAQRYHLRQAHDSDLHGRVRLQSNRCNLRLNYFKKDHTFILQYDHIFLAWITTVYQLCGELHNYGRKKVNKSISHWLTAPTVLDGGFDCIYTESGPAVTENNFISLSPPEVKTVFCFFSKLQNQKVW